MAMKIESRETFGTLNIFGLGEENVKNTPYSSASSWLK